MPFEKTLLRPADFYRERDIELRLSATVVTRRPGETGARAAGRRANSSSISCSSPPAEEIGGSRSPASICPASTTCARWPTPTASGTRSRAGPGRRRRAWASSAPRSPRRCASRGVEVVADRAVQDAALPGARRRHRPRGRGPPSRPRRRDDPGRRRDGVRGRRQGRARRDPPAAAHRVQPGGLRARHRARHRARRGHRACGSTTGSWSTISAEPTCPASSPPVTSPITFTPCAGARCGWSTGRTASSRGRRRAQHARTGAGLRRGPLVLVRSVRREHPVRGIPRRLGPDGRARQPGRAQVPRVLPGRGPAGVRRRDQSGT